MRDLLFVHDGIWAKHRWSGIDLPENPTWRDEWWLFCVEGIMPDVLGQKGGIDLIQAVSRKTGVRLVQMVEKLKAQTCGSFYFRWFMDASFLSNILTPGSSLHPSFLIIVDCTFLLLLLIFIVLALLTSGNIHVLILMTIELCLWASVKWCTSVHVSNIYIHQSLISSLQVYCRASKCTSTGHSHDSARRETWMKGRLVSSLSCALALFIPTFCKFSALLCQRKN